ncbi:hypothetical protein LXL04_028816 [Taraxacum kok-saghyz]
MPTAVSAFATLNFVSSLVRLNPPSPNATSASTIIFHFSSRSIASPTKRESYALMNKTGGRIPPISSSIAPRRRFHLRHTQVLLLCRCPTPISPPAHSCSGRKPTPKVNFDLFGLHSTCCIASRDRPGLIASSSEDGCVCWFDMRCKDLLFTMDVAQNPISSLCFKPENEVKVLDVHMITCNLKSSFLAAADDGGDIKIIDIGQKCLYKTLRAAHGSVSFNYFSFTSLKPPKRSLRDIAELYGSELSIKGIQEYRNSSGLKQSANLMDMS